MEIEQRRRARRSNTSLTIEEIPASNKKSEFASESPSKKSKSTPLLDVNSKNEINDQMPKKRGRPPKKTTETEKIISPPATNLTNSSTTPKKRGRPSKNTPNSKKSASTTTQRSLKEYFIESSSESENEESEDEFKPDLSIETAESSSTSEVSDKILSEAEIKNETSDTSIMNVSVKRTGKKRQILSKIKSSEATAAERSIIQLERFDPNEVIKEWKYEIDPDSKVFRKPIIPLLNEKAIAQFVSKDSKPRCVIYSCPFCNRVYTYNLVFKNHLYTCEKNTNVPQYLLLCVEPTCGYTGAKRQEMINHFFEMHHNDGSNNDSSLIETDFQRTKAKQSQLEVSRYFYIDKAEFQFTFDYFNKSIAVNYKRLKYLTEIYMNHHYSKSKSLYDTFTINTTGYKENLIGKRFRLNVTPSMNLKFQFSNENSGCTVLELKPFEIYQNFNDSESFKVINVIEQVSVLDWCPTKLRNLKASFQYLTFATCPSQQISNFFSANDMKLNTQEVKQLFNKNYVKNLFESPNIIYICKFANMNLDKIQPVEVFGFLNRKLGHVNSLKWRPDCGASISDNFDDSAASLQQDINFDSSFIGYLLVTSSNGNGYLICVQDMTKLEVVTEKNPIREYNDGFVTSVENLKVYEFKRNIILKTNCDYGQCTSSDWSQLNGSTEIALGYANGNIAIFKLNSNTLQDQLKIYKDNHNESSEDIIIYPVKTFSAHQSFVRALRWSKLKSSLLASGSTFSRDVKCWDTNLNKAFIEYEIFACEFAFTLHSNCLFIGKEANLKGDNHLYELDVSFNAFNKEKDDTRSHSSLFFTDGTMASMDQNDYFNKFLVCDSRGNVILSSANNPKFWLAKNHLMFNSFSRVCKIDVLNTPSTQVNKENQLDVENKSTKIIKINLERKKSSKKTTQDNEIIPNQLDMNNLTTIRWNINFNYLNWFAVGSQSGFIFLQRLDELTYNIDD